MAKLNDHSSSLTCIFKISFGWNYKLSTGSISGQEGQICHPLHARE